MLFPDQDSGYLREEQLSSTSSQARSLAGQSIEGWHPLLPRPGLQTSCVTMCAPFSQRYSACREDLVLSSMGRNGGSSFSTSYSVPVKHRAAPCCRVLDIDVAKLGEHKARTYPDEEGCPQHRRPAPLRQVMAGMHTESSEEVQVNTLSWPVLPCSKTMVLVLSLGILSVARGHAGPSVSKI